MTATWRAQRSAARISRTLYTQIHPDLHPGPASTQSKLTLMSESLPQRRPDLVPRKAGDGRPPAEIPEAERYYTGRALRLAASPRVSIASRAAKVVL